MGFDLSNYVDVAERLRMLKEKHPEATLRPYDPANPIKLMEIGGREFIVYTAVCYRYPDDPTPAIAVAAEPSFGKTSYTKDSEVMNAETSAWGRAIQAALACDNQRVASLNEVQNRREDQAGDTAPRAHIPSDTSTRAVLITQAQKGLVNKLAAEVAKGELEPILQKLFKKANLDTLEGKEASQLIKHLIEMKGQQ